MKLSVEITDARGKDSYPIEVEIYFDREGLEFLQKRLSKLKAPGDHIHMMTPAWGMDDLSEDKVIAANSLTHHLRLTLL